MTAPCVLVIDDEQLIRWSLKTHLERAGYRVVVAETGKQGRDRFGEDVCLVVIDLRLPDAYGFDLAREFKRERPDCQVILITAYGTPGVAAEAESLGVPVLDKPFDLEQMTNAVENALAGAGSHH